MAAAPKASRQTPKQRAASVGNLKKARAAQRLSGALHHHTAKQKAASQRNLVKARSAQRSRRAGKTPVSSKAATAPWGDGGLHSHPVCAMVAIAESLADQAGVRAADEEIMALYQRAGTISIAGVLEAVAEYGLAGRRLRAFEAADPDMFFPGLVCGIRFSLGYHAVMTVPEGMLSWGTVLPLLGTPEEAWILDWEDPHEPV